jgi:hypothetical protein
MSGWIESSQKIAFAWIKLFWNQLYEYVDWFMFRYVSVITAIYLPPFEAIAFYRSDEGKGKDVVINNNNGYSNNDNCD